MSANRLPAAAATRLSMLAQAAHDAAALAQAAMAAVVDAEKRMAAVINRRDSASTPEARRAAQAAADEVEAELLRLRATRQARFARRDGDGATATSVRSWLDRLPPGVALEPHGRPPALPREGETLVVAVERVRGEVAAMQRELQVVRRAPPPRADLRRAARARAAELAERGRPLIRAAGGEFEVSFRRRVAAHPGMDPDEVAAFAAWLDPERLIARLEAEVDALPEDASAMPAAERERREAELVAQILDLEHDEESLIASALAAGQDVARRRQADPRAILGVRFAARSASRAA